MWLVQARQLATATAFYFCGRRLLYDYQSHGRADYFARYFLLNEDILGFMMTSMW
jgi:hypothetical protein